MPAYWVVNLHSSYKISQNVEVFGMVRNLFDQHYYAAGTFFQSSGFNSNTFGGTHWADPLMVG